MCYNIFMKVTQEKILAFLGELKPELEASGIEKLALFGSYATQNQNVYSDIDIAIQKKKDFLEHYSAYEYFNSFLSSSCGTHIGLQITKQTLYNP